MEHTHKDGVSTTTRTTDPSKSKLSDALLRKVGGTKSTALYTLALVATCLVPRLLPRQEGAWPACNHMQVVWTPYLLLLTIQA